MKNLYRTLLISVCLAAVGYSGGLASTGSAQIPLPGGATILEGPATNGLQSVTVCLPSLPVSAEVSSGMAPGMQMPISSDGAQPPCVSCPPSAVSWWPAEGDASDAFGRYNGVPQNGLSLAAGAVGQAFSFNGSSQAIQAPDLQHLGPTFSFEAWVNPGSQSGSQQWIVGQGYGPQIVLHPGYPGLNVLFYVNTDPYHWYQVSGSSQIAAGQWSHLVGTWDGTHLVLYVNGVARQAVPGIVPYDSGCPLTIGGANNVCGSSGQYYHGLIDEVTYYSQALSAADVQALYNAGSAGKCPAIVGQPISQTADMGDTVTFAVVAAGRPPLTYQWFFGGTPIAGETSSSLTLPGVQYSQQGDYYVQVASAGGNLVTSSTATLTVQAAWPNPMMNVTGPRQNYTFRNGVIYDIASRVELYGETTIQGGAIIILDWPHYPASSLAIMGTLTCKTDEAYLPAFLTSMDDDTLGPEMYPYSSAAPVMGTSGETCLDLTQALDPAPSLKNLRIRYADRAVISPPAKHLDVWDCQFLACNKAIVAGQGATVAFHNSLVASCNTAVSGAASFVAVTGEHLTADATSFWGQGQPGQIALVNSIILGTVAAGPTLTYDHTALKPSGDNFAPDGWGNYYLARSSPYRGVGSTVVSPSLLSEFQHRTTQAPLALHAGWEMSGELTLCPQVERYSGGAPDYGYYYPALDYAISWIINLGTITILPGTALGCRDGYLEELDLWTDWAFDLREGSRFISRGTPANPIVLADVQLVQEQRSWPCQVLLNPDFCPDPDPTVCNAPPFLDMRFCNSFAAAGRFHVRAGEDYRGGLNSLDSLVNWNLQDCAFHGGQICLGPPVVAWVFPPTDWIYGSCAVSWKNNLFEDVSVALDPNLYEFDIRSCDMSFEAYNNLFRGATWFRLAPADASAGHWVFRDNLFDKVNFLQATELPLDFDHNAYRPMTSSELQSALYFSPFSGDWPTAAQLLTAQNGTDPNEPVLPSALPYQAGPYGNYYLPNTTPLYHAGSRTADAAGLFHYTTQVLQTKEGAGQPVNIGLHYVATAGPGSTQPLDSDTGGGDGIPDYVENWHGDGRHDWADETDWSNPTTATDPNTQQAIPDSQNALYDDVDLSGNGLVGRVKRSLNLQPFDTSNPLALLGTSQLFVSGEQTIPLASSGQLGSNGALTPYVNGQAAETGDVVKDTDGNWSFVWDTTTLPNGLYTVQLAYPYTSPSPSSDVPIQRVALGPLAILEVNNPITFDPICDAFTDKLFIHGTLNVPASAYTIKIYAPGTPRDQPLATLQGNPSGQVIDDSWDFTSEGVNVDTGLECEISLSQSGQSDELMPVSKFYWLEVWSAGNGFTMAWGWNQGNSTQLQHRGDKVRMGLVDMLGSDLEGPPFDLLPAGPGGNVPYASSFQLDGSQGAHDWLLSSMAAPNSFNFFFWGHGYSKDVRSSVSSISCADSISPPAALTSDEIAKATGNPNSANDSSAEKIFNHPYTFVFMDACGAYCRGMVRAFGIPFSANGTRSTVSQYQERHRIPRAFVGWDVSIEGSDIRDETADWNRVLAQKIVLGTWQSGGSVLDAMTAWDSYLPDKTWGNGLTYAQLYQFNSQSPKDWPQKAPMWTWKISGCLNLTRYTPIP